VTALLLAAVLALQEPPPAPKDAPQAGPEQPPGAPEAPPGLIPTQDWIRQDADPRKVAVTVQAVVFLAILSLAPGLLMMVTSFTRIIVVLSFLRRALATQDLPPNAVIFGLSLLLTFIVMAPVGAAVKQDAVDPYLGEKIGQREAIDRATVHLRGFMFRQVRPDDVSLFMELSKQPAKPGGWTEQDVPTHVLIPAFVVSELRRAFVMGFALFLPFLVIDLVVAAVLTSMGMLMMPPVLVSLPLKLLLFILVDGWALVVGSLIASFA
jgi:flagellar biosynthetic protein FliP